VTRFGEFSLIGRLFALGGVFKISEVALTFGIIFSAVKVMY
jgi:hypothetical protein